MKVRDENSECCAQITNAYMNQERIDNVDYMIYHKLVGIKLYASHCFVSDANIP